jgi:hypothetical protein
VHKRAALFSREIDTENKFDMMGTAAYSEIHDKTSAAVLKE